MTGRTPAVAVMAVGMLLLTGCGYAPSTVALDGSVVDSQAALPAACLDSGLDLALGFGAYAVPIGGAAANAAELPSWQAAALQIPPATTISTGEGPFTVCAYVADHPTPFSTRGGDDEILCVLVDPAGTATLLGMGSESSGATPRECAPAEGQP